MGQAPGRLALLAVGGPPQGRHQQGQEAGFQQEGVPVGRKGPAAFKVALGDRRTGAPCPSVPMTHHWK